MSTKEGPTPTLSPLPNPEPNDKLDPGPPPRPKRNLRCINILCTLLALLGLGAASLAFVVIRHFARGVKDPHAKLYQDLTQPYRPQDVVRPLIDGNQTFDIVATVWLRAEDEEEGTGTDGIVQHGKWRGREHRKWARLQEKAIFSKTVFTGLTLKDKQLTTSVDFQVPTSIFKKKILNNYDLRGSFVLVPTPASVLDHVHSYSSWIPLEARYPPVRSWVHNPGLTLRDEVIDSYGTFTPLLAFFDIKSKCPHSEPQESRDEHDEEEDIDQDQDVDENAILPPEVLKSREKWTSTKGKSVLSAHPYIISRTFISVADMTQVLNRQAYDNVHNRLRTLSCGRLGMAMGRRARPRWQDCARSFLATGTQEVRIKLARPIGNGKSDNLKFQTEWLYAPYFSVSWTGWGPRDLIPVPVNREACRPESDINVPAVPDEEFVNVTWNIAFSSRIPALIPFVDAMDHRQHNYNMSSPEHKHMFEQALLESMDGLFGHRHREAFHPRRKVVLSFVQDLMFYVSVVLEVAYWYTRTSTTGISISGTGILAVATLSGLVMDVACLTIQNEEPFGLYSFARKLVTERTFRAVLMIKAITRAEVVRWRRTWIPAIHFAPATHSERTSQRLDARVTFKTKVITYTALASFFTLVYYFDQYIVYPRGGMVIKNKLASHLYALPQCLILPALTLGRYLQILLNFRSKSFAGMYATAACVKTVEIAFGIMARSPWVVGEALLNPPVTYYDVGELVGCCVLVVQSRVYAAASDLDDEDSMR